MITRRMFVSLAASSVAARAFASVDLGSGRLALYANIGSTVLHYEVDVAKAELTRKGSVTVPAGVQYGWPHVSGRCLYVACSDWAKIHYLVALRIDPQTGELSKHGEQEPLPFRPIHMTTDVPSENILVAFNVPSGVRVFRVNHDLTIGREVPQPGVKDGGIYAHQIKVTLDNRHAILVTRGVSATAKEPEQPGALKIFDYDHGVLSNEASIAPNGGFGFGPRHLDFHPTKPWVYVSLERESKMYMYRMENGRISGDATYIRDTPSEPSKGGPRQLAGTIHVHPNGRFVYVANRNDATVDFNGKKVSAGGENSIVVYSIDQTTGEPTAIQHADTRKIYPRTFNIDPSGRMMAVQHILPVNFREGNDVRVAAAGMTIFRIGDDGKLTCVRVYDEQENGDDQMFWGAMVRI